LKNPSKSNFAPKNIKPFPEILKNLKVHARIEFALFYLLIATLLELIALGPLFIFFYTLIGADGAEELIPEYDYTDDFTAKDYPTPGSRPTDFETHRHCNVVC
jgi:hypothetical protein